MPLFFIYMIQFFNNRIRLLLASSFILTSLLGCHSRPSIIVEYKPVKPKPVIETTIPSMGHAIQAGAFSSLENAVRLTDSLQKLGLEPYYFKDDSGLYKVRFGNFTSKDLALARANDLRENGLIEEFYIVAPEDYSWKKDNIPDGTVALRKEIVRTAKSFIGIPYRFGGENAKEGFDCSGLTMASYRLNGLELPRASWQQWTTGRLIDKKDAREADLVFFDTRRKGRVFPCRNFILENGQFVHAPKNR